MVFRGFWLVSMVFQVGFMVFHGFWLVSMVFQGGFMVFRFLVGFHVFSRWFHGFCLVSMIFKVVLWFCMVFDDFQVDFHRH